MHLRPNSRVPVQRSKLNKFNFLRQTGYKYLSPYLKIGVEVCAYIVSYTVVFIY